MLSNVRSLENKLDLIQLSRSTQHEARDCCVFVFTETWLNDNIPDSAIQLNRLTCYQADRDTTLSGKSRGGGLCVYINKEWCNNAAVVSKHCSSLVEFMFVKCRPFYLPREFTAIVIVTVYIPPCENAKDALRELYSAISEQQTNNPDGFFIIAGDFNHANIKAVLPKFYQNVNFATRGNNTLDFVYTTEKNAYKAVPRPHLGYSDHISVMLIPAYRPRFKNSSQFGQRMLPQHYRTAFSAQTGACLKRRPPTTTTQTCRSTLKLWLLTSKSAWMMWQSPRPSPHVQTKSRGWQQRFVGC